MHGDVWSPPQDGAERPRVGARLVYAIPRRVFEREVVAWLRGARWWAHWLVVLPALGVIGLGAVALFVAMLWDVPPVGVVGVCLMAVGLLPVALPKGMARAAWRQRRDHPVTTVAIVDGRVRVTGAGTLDLDPRQITAIRDRRGVLRVEFGRRFALFVPRRTREGDPEAFLAALAEAREAPADVVDLPDGVAIRVRAPGLLRTLAHNYRAMLATPRFWLMAVGFGWLSVLLCAGSFVAGPLLADLFADIAVLFAALVLVLFLLPGAYVLLALGRQERVETDFVVTPDALVVRSPTAVVRVPWERVGPPRWRDRVLMVRLDHNPVLISRHDVVSGDLDAFAEALAAAHA